MSVADLPTVIETGRRSMASVSARKGVTAAQLGGAIGLALAEGPRATTGGGLTLLGTGPGSWLALDASGDPAFARALASRLAGLAAVADQSGSYHAIRLGGEQARRLVQSGCPIDLHSAGFAPGDVAVTQIAHMGVVLWQVDAAPTFELACFRSYAGSFRHWLDDAMATL